MTVLRRRGLVLALVAMTMAVAGLCVSAVPARAQQGPVDGHVSLKTDYLPNVGDTVELRARLFVERQIDARPNLRFSFSGWAEGLVADRPLVDGGLAGGDSTSTRRSGTTRDALARAHEAYVDLRAGSFDVRAGLSNVVWGRLDEVQPSDVINPLDISRYLFEGRSEARLPVPLVRTRWFPSEALAIEGVWVPLFRRGRADFLDEDSSPFNLLTPEALTAALLRGRDLCPGDPICLPVPVQAVVDRDEPERTLENSQGGLRVSATSGRVDWSVSAYRGFEPFGMVTLDPSASLLTGPLTPTLSPKAGRGDPESDHSVSEGTRIPSPRRGEGARVRGLSVPGQLRFVETYPRFTMVASDVEAVRGQWAIRGEAAAFLDSTFQSDEDLTLTSGHAIEAGGSVERKAGAYRVNGAVLLQRRDTDAWSDTDVSLVLGAQRSFARDTRRVLLFGVWNMADASGFLRSIGTWSLRDNLALEGSVGWFFGEGTDTLSRFGTRDFAYLRLKAYF